MDPGRGLQLQGRSLPSFPSLSTSANDPALPVHPFFWLNPDAAVRPFLIFVFMTVLKNNNLLLVRSRNIILNTEPPYCFSFFPRSPHTNDILVLFGG